MGKNLAYQSIYVAEAFQPKFSTIGSLSNAIAPTDLHERKGKSIW